MKIEELRKIINDKYYDDLNIELPEGDFILDHSQLDHHRIVYIRLKEQDDAK